MATPATARMRGYRGGVIRRTTLPGGLRVVTESMPGSRTFSVGCFVGVGSRHENDRLHGASHFLEHVLFKGTKKRAAEEISAAVESVGGDLNAYTAKEHTCFYARVLDVDAKMSVEVLNDMITSSLVRTHDVEAERAVILDEIAMHSDDPVESAQELVSSHLFAGSGLARPVIGSHSSITELSRRQIVGHWRRRYRAESMVIAAAGHVDHDELVGWVTQLDQLTTAGGSPTSAPATHNGGGLVGQQRRLEQCSAVLAVPGPGVFDDRRYPLGLLSLIVGGGMSSRLFVEVRERRGLTYGIDAGETAYSDAGQWSVDWQCAPGKLAAIVDIVRATLGDVAEHGVSDGELARAKGQLRGQTILSYEGPYARMSRLGGNALLEDDRSLGEVLERFDAVQSEDVRQAAVALFEQSPVLGVVGPRVPQRRLEALLSRWG